MSNLSGVDRHRLLAQHGNPGFQESHGNVSMTAMWGGDVNGVHLAYEVAQVATRRADTVIVCESRDPGGITANNSDDLMADSSGRAKERGDNAPMPNNPPPHQASIAP